MKKVNLTREQRLSWVAALRSGQYFQGRYDLCNSEQYCCLGVLGRTLGYTDDDMIGYGMISDVDIHGLSNLSLLQEGYFTKLNDEEGYSFEQIADLIDAMDDDGDPLEDEEPC